MFLFLKDKLYNTLRIVHSHCGDGKTITLYFKVIVSLFTKGTVIMTEIAEGQGVLRSTIVDPQSTSGFLFQHASNFHLKWLEELNANDAVIYEKQITLVMQTPSWYS
ncbi:hypothetical protein ALC57_14365 [Trachymyrmex cornetzi]|uniref:Uncharacterized protein n=1 Tax=Trachymyrmex cornetzi TaxID=471704 RepID=A0A195DKI8_9HYME|nr:hypothetical protein ALC57_14365 [Trachymyrmex cornetzi]